MDVGCAAIRSVVVRQPNAIGYANHRSRSHDAVIRVLDEAGNLIETYELHRRLRWKFFVELRLAVSVEGIRGKELGKRRDV